MVLLKDTTEFYQATLGFKHGQEWRQNIDTVYEPRILRFNYGWIYSCSKLYSLILCPDSIASLRRRHNYCQIEREVYWNRFAFVAFDTYHANGIAQIKNRIDIQSVSYYATSWEPQESQKHCASRLSGPNNSYSGKFVKLSVVFKYICQRVYGQNHKRI